MVFQELPGRMGKPVLGQRGRQQVPQPQQRAKLQGLQGLPANRPPAGQRGFEKGMGLGQRQVGLPQMGIPVPALPLDLQPLEPVGRDSQRVGPAAVQVEKEILEKTLRASMAVVFVFLGWGDGVFGLCRLSQKQDDTCRDIQQSHLLGTRLLDRRPPEVPPERRAAWSLHSQGSSWHRIQA